MSPQAPAPAMITLASILSRSGPGAAHRAARRAQPLGPQHRYRAVQVVGRRAARPPGVALRDGIDDRLLLMVVQPGGQALSHRHHGLPRGLDQCGVQRLEHWVAGSPDNSPVELDGRRHDPLRSARALRASMVIVGGGHTGQFRVGSPCRGQRGRLDLQPLPGFQHRADVLVAQIPAEDAVHLVGRAHAFTD
jgi:hypothetical protein